MINKSKLCVSKQYYMNGEVLSLPNSDYKLLRGVWDGAFP